MRSAAVLLLASGWMLASPWAQAQTLEYDDGTASGSYTGMAAGDAEMVVFTPDHPCQVTALRVWFTGTPAETAVYLWEDWGEAGFPRWDAEPLFSATVTPTVEEWTEIPVPEGTVVLEAPREFLAGQIIVTDELHIAADGSAPTSGQERSMLYMDEAYYIAGDADLMIRVDVEYQDVVETRSFTDVTTEAGLGTTKPHRVAWGDYDGDGDDDLLVSGSRLFENDGGTFTDVTVQAGIREVGDVLICGGSGGVWADYDNDGHLDFYSTSHGFVPICAHEPDPDWYCNHFSDGAIPVCLDGYCRLEGDPWPVHDCLFHNEGDGTFRVVDEEDGPYDYSPTEGAAWADYDNDGFVDLYVANYEMPTSWTGDGMLGQGTPDLLWHNNGDGTFTDVTETALTTSCGMRSGRGVNWGDFDNDGLMDIFVSVYRLQPNCLWRNNGDGTFEEVAESRGVQGIPITGAYGHTIGSQWMDFDNDGDLDLFSANLAHPRFIEFSDKSMLLVNGGEPEWTFTDVWAESGFLYQETNSEPAWADYDNDGLPDIYVTDVYEGRLSQLYRQTAAGTFEDVTYRTGTAVDNGWGAAWADWDGDGDLDLATRALLRNDEDNTNHWLQVHLTGTVSNRAAIGAKVIVHGADDCGSPTFMRQVEGGKGTTNQDSLTLHFGLGDCTRADLVQVWWPSGALYEEENVDADQRLQIVEWDPSDVEEEMEPVPDAPPDASTDTGTDDGTSTGSESGCGCSLVR